MSVSKKVLLHFFLFSFYFSFSYAQAPGTLWTKTYGGTESDIGRSVQQTSDKGYIITGSTSSFGAGGNDVYLIKTDASGDTLWTRTYGGINDDHGYSVQQTSDQGYVVVGQTNSFGAGETDVYLIKTNANGDTIWTRTYGGMSSEACYSVQQTLDQGYIMAGWTESFGPGAGEVYLIKTDVNGDTLWTKIFGGTNYEYSFSVQQTSEGGYIVTGYTWSYGSGQADVYLVKTDANGDTIWTRIYGGTGHDKGHQVQQTVDKGYIIAGSTNSFGTGFYDFYLVKTDSFGDTIWTKTYGGQFYEFGESVQQTSDSGYIIAGYTDSYGAGGADAYLVRTDANGDTLWTKTFGGIYGDAIYTVQQTLDSGYIIAGHTSSFGAGYEDVYLIKTEPDPSHIAENKIINPPFATLNISPNPFSKTAVISFQCPVISEKEKITLSIYDLSGRLIKSFTLSTDHLALSTAVSWDGTDNSGNEVQSGVYFVWLEAGGMKEIEKVILLR